MKFRIIIIYCIFSYIQLYGSSAIDLTGLFIHGGIVSVRSNSSQETFKILSNETTSQKYWNPLAQCFLSDQNNSMEVNAISAVGNSLYSFGKKANTSALSVLNEYQVFRYYTLTSLINGNGGSINLQGSSRLATATYSSQTEAVLVGGALDTGTTPRGFIGQPNLADHNIVGSVQPNFQSINSIALQPMVGVVYAGFNSGGDLMVGRALLQAPFVADNTFAVTQTNIMSGNYSDRIGVAVDSQGRIIVVGTGAGNMRIARFQPNGGLDTTFNGVGYLTVAPGAGHAVAITSFDTIVAVGVDTNAPTRYMVAVVKEDGTFLSTFGGTGVETYTGVGNSIAYGVALVPASDGSLSNIAIAGSTVDGGSTYMQVFMVDFSAQFVANFCSNTASPGENTQPLIYSTDNKAYCIICGINNGIPTLVMGGSDGGNYPNYAFYARTA